MNNPLKRHYKSIYKYTRTWKDYKGEEHSEEVVDNQIVLNVEGDSQCVNVVKTETTIEYDRWLNTSYEALVSKLIRANYSLDDELALLRQKEEKAEEYQTYYQFAESCKSQARTYIAERESALQGGN